MIEQFYAVSWIQKSWHSIFVGFIYALIGIFSSILQFKSYGGIVSLGFVSVLLIPTVSAFFKRTEQKQMRARFFSIRRFYHDHGSVIKSTLLLFLGIFFAYTMVGLILPAAAILEIFQPQIQTVGIEGAAFQSSLFGSILQNNLFVFLVCFFVSLAFGAGSVLFLTWNASVWGIAMAYFVRQAAAVGGNPVLVFFATALPFMPHLITEAFAYVSAAIVGGIVSKAVINEDFRSKRFSRIIRDAVLFMGFGFILVVLGAAIEVYVFPML